MAYEFGSLLPMLREMRRLEDEGWFQREKNLTVEYGSGYPLKLHVIMQKGNRQELLMWGENPDDEGSFVKKLPF